MTLKDWLKENHRVVAFALAAIGPVLAGVYTNIYTSALTQAPGATVAAAALSLGWWNALVPAFAFTLWGQFYVSGLPNAALDDVRAHLVLKVLAAACKSLVYPRSLDAAPVRAIVSMIDRKRSRRIAKYSFNTDPDPERQADWPIEFGVTGEAITTRQVVLKELQPDHHTTYPDDVKMAVLQDIKTILAAPILDPGDRRGPPLGVVAFDSVMSIQDLGFGSREVRNVAQAWADVIAIIITQHELAEEIQ